MVKHKKMVSREEVEKIRKKAQRRAQLASFGSSKTTSWFPREVKKNADGKVDYSG